MWSNVVIYPQTTFGPPVPGSPEAGRALREKITARLGAIGHNIRFLPLVEAVVEETAEMRAAYRLMLRVPEVKAAFLTKVLSVSALDLAISPFSSSPRDMAIAELVRYAFKVATGGPRRMIQNILVGGLMDGYSVCEKVWQIEQRGKWRGRYTLKALKSKDTERIQLLGDQFRNVEGIFDELTGTTFHPGNCVIYSYFSIFENPLGMSDFRAAYAAYWKLDTAWKLRMIGLDRFTLPALMGTYSDRSLKGELEDALANMRAMSWTAIPEGAKIEALKLAAMGDAEFKSAVADLREEIFLAISGAYLQSLSSGQGSMRGSSKVHQSTSELLQWALKEDVTDVINTQVIPDIVGMNFRNADNPSASLSAVSPEDLQRELAIDNGLSQIGLPLSKKAAYVRYNREPPEDESDELTKGGGAGAAGGMPPGGGDPSAGLFSEKTRRRKKKHRSFLERRKDALGREQCYEDGRHVPCPDNGGPAAPAPRDPRSPEARKERLAAARGKGPLPTGDRGLDYIAKALWADDVARPIAADKDAHKVVARRVEAAGEAVEAALPYMAEKAKQLVTAAAVTVVAGAQDFFGNLPTHAASLAVTSIEKALLENVIIPMAEGSKTTAAAKLVAAGITFGWGKFGKQIKAGAKAGAAAAAGMALGALTSKLHGGGQDVGQHAEGDAIDLDDVTRRTIAVWESIRKQIQDAGGDVPPLDFDEVRAEIEAGLAAGETNAE